MEYVEGTGLREYLNRKATFDIGQIVAIMSQLLLALDFAHERGVVHRDVKPANLILTGTGALKVADFGIARIDTSNLTNAGMVMGTPSYMSPEQCQGKEVDKRSDLFSAGVVLYELLTGEKPFSGSIEAIAFKICYEEAKPPSELSKLPVSAALDAITMTAMTKDPTARFQNAKAFNRALRLALDPDLNVKRDAQDATEINLAAVTLQPQAAPVWDDTTLHTIERELADLVGPMARVMVKKAAAKSRDTSELYALISDSITDPEVRQRFLDGMQKAAAERSVASKTGTGVRGTMPPQLRSVSGDTGALTPLDPGFVEQTTTRLAVYLGPVAKVVARRAAKEAANRQQFVQLLANHLGTQERIGFLREFGYVEFE
jgi:serine/threonine-protein kinase